MFNNTQKLTIKDKDVKSYIASNGPLIQIIAEIINLI